MLESFFGMYANNLFYLEYYFPVTFHVITVTVRLNVPFLLFVLIFVPYFSSAFLNQL